MEKRRLVIYRFLLIFVIILSLFLISAVGFQRITGNEIISSNEVKMTLNDLLEFSCSDSTFFLRLTFVDNNLYEFTDILDGQKYSVTLSPDGTGNLAFQGKTYSIKVEGIYAYIYAPMGCEFVDLNPPLSCKPFGEICVIDSDCCSGFACNNNLCGYQCTDSDDGKNYNLKGAATNTAPGGIPMEDICDTNTILKEGLCTGDGELDYEYHKCPISCKDGACSELPCSNSGSSCLSDTDCCDNLFCSNGNRWGIKAIPGICQLPICTDTDGGINYFLKGTATSTNHKVMRDSCSFKKLYEQYCGEDGDIHTLIYSCDNSVCIDGACASCKSSGQACTSNYDCCSGLNCINLKCTSFCKQLNEKCTSNYDCCSGSSCIEGICSSLNQITLHVGDSFFLSSANLILKLSSVQNITKSRVEFSDSSGNRYPVIMTHGQGRLSIEGKTYDIFYDCSQDIDTKYCFVTISAEDSISCISGTCMNQFCTDGTLEGQCSVRAKSKYCTNGDLVDYCVSCGCPSDYKCQNGHCSSQFIGPNKKLASAYPGKELFLISDADWKNVLPFISVTTWTEGSDIKKYPTLIYHNEDDGAAIDIDSIIYFMQQYQPNQVTIIGNTPQELDNLLIASPELGAGIKNIQRINSEDYLDYWETFNKIVYVEDSYELALLASTYASLINAPLIIKGSNADISLTFVDRNIICVGDVSPSGTTCTESYTLDTLQQKYKDVTNTDKIILVNPDDWNIAVEENFKPDKSPSLIHNLYTKTSLSAPILASAKHELLLSTKEKDYQKIDDFIKEKISKIDVKYLTIMASDVIPHRAQDFPCDLYFSLGCFHSLDQTQYSDINDDKFPEIFTGRIFGISSSDVSSYIARDLFHNNIFTQTKNIKFIASAAGYTQYGFLADSDKFATEFKTAGYNSVSVTSPQEAHIFNPNEWTAQDLIFYNDHGGVYWAGISSWDIPLLDSSVILNHGCLTCSNISNPSVFCANAIRRGAMEYIGEVSYATGYKIYYNTLNNIYYQGLSSFGEAFTKSYSSSQTYFPESSATILIGDPTFQIKPPYLLKHPLCSPTSNVEICNNNIDDDCNNKIDELPCFDLATNEWRT